MTSIIRGHITCTGGEVEGGGVGVERGIGGKREVGVNVIGQEGRVVYM